MRSVGVADHAGWAILVTVDARGALVDKRRVELVAAGLPKLPYHHDAQGLPLDVATKLIDTVRRSAEKHAKAALAELPAKIDRIAIRACPPLPATIAERLSNYRAQNVADTVMFRSALAEAATSAGWDVHWYETKTLMPAAMKLPVQSAPWSKDHRVAMAAAISIRRRA